MAEKSMPKRFHLNRPDLAQAVVAALSGCKDVKAQQRLLAMRLAASGQFTAAQIAEVATQIKDAGNAQVS